MAKEVSRSLVLKERQALLQMADWYGVNSWPCFVLHQIIF